MPDEKAKTGTAMLCPYGTMQAGRVEYLWRIVVK
jgi:hypothetical protein